MRHTTQLRSKVGLGVVILSLSLDIVIAIRLELFLSFLFLAKKNWRYRRTFLHASLLEIQHYVHLYTAINKSSRREIKTSVTVQLHVRS